MRNSKRFLITFIPEAYNSASIIILFHLLWDITLIAILFILLIFGAVLLLLTGCFIDSHYAYDASSIFLSK